MVGNDIIDIQETKRLSQSPKSGWQRPGFLEKVFSPEEQALIDVSAEPFTIVWQLWSMKESAYKVFTQAGGTRFYNPSKIECQLDMPNSGRVKIGNLRLKTNTIINADYIFTTAMVENSDVVTSIFQLPSSNREQQGNFTHQQLLTDFSKNNSLNYSDLSIQKSATGVPTLSYQNKKINASISMTHHGKFGAYSIM